MWWHGLYIAPDLDTVLELFDRLARLQPAAKTSAALAQLPTRQTSYTLVTLLGKRMDEKKPADALKVLDLYLATARKQFLGTPKAASTSRRRPQTGGTGVQLYTKSRRYGGQLGSCCRPSGKRWMTMRSQ